MTMPPAKLHTDPLTDGASRALFACRNELTSLFPHLDAAFAALPLCPCRDTAALGTDGRSLLFSPLFVAKTFAATPAALRRGFLHVLLHCLFLHPFHPERQEDPLWHLACDMAVEQMIQREHKSRLDLPENNIKATCLAILGPTASSAEQIRSLLRSGAFPFTYADMAAAFVFDDPALWQNSDCDGKDRWQQILSYTNENRRNRRRGNRAGHGTETITELTNGPYDYRKFLHRFAVPKEELELDHESFDYIYYHLGMERYDNLPLMEPLEYKEGSKLEELVIAIDTSGSCSRETVQNFLSDTYRILSARENFFSRMTVHIIQCDCLIQRTAVIHSAQEWERFSRSITIEGRGGTDFTPVFRYVDQLRREGQLKKLKALLYFTDGDGFFPREKPDYETAFVFLEQNEFMDAVPPWALKLLVR